MKDIHIFDNGFLADASVALKEMMADLARTRSLKAGEVLFEHGDEGDTFYAVVDGALEFSILSADGRKLSLDVMHPGALFGEIALFDPGPRTATVIALGPARLLAVANADMIAAIERSPDLAIDMLRLAGQRMRWMGFQLSEQVFLPLPARLARKVLHLSAHLDGTEPMLSLSQADLAEFAGASREAVSKIISRWGKSGIVRPSRGGLRLLNRAALQDLAEAAEI